MPETQTRKLGLNCERWTFLLKMPLKGIWSLFGFGTEHNAPAAFCRSGFPFGASAFALFYYRGIRPKMGAAWTSPFDGTALPTLFGIRRPIGAFLSPLGS